MNDFYSITKVVLYLFALIASLTILFRAVPLTKRQLDKVRQEGLVHITTKDRISFIQSDEKVTLKASDRLASYSNAFKCSTFFFIGRPTLWGLTYNFKYRFLKQDLVLIHISGNEIENLLPFLKRRRLDGAVMLTGDLVIHAKCYPYRLEGKKHKVYYISVMSCTYLLISLGILKLL